jgi:hypothetical protein
MTLSRVYSAARRAQPTNDEREQRASSCVFRQIKEQPDECALAINAQETSRNTINITMQHERQAHSELGSYNSEAIDLFSGEDP